MKYEIVILTHLSVAPMAKTMGAYRVADSLRRIGFSVQVIGMTDIFSEEDLTKTILHFVDEKTKIIGVSTTFYQFVDVKNMHKTYPPGITQSTKNVLKSVKEIYPKIKFISGGAHSHLQIGDSLFDAVFHGYSDNAVIDYALSLSGSKKPLWKYSTGTKIIEGETYPVIMEHLRHQWEDNDIIFQGETLPIEIGRGCIFKCKFCNFQLTGKKKLDYIRDYEFLKEEFLRNYERYGVTNYSFCDDTFNDSTYKLEKIHKIVSDLPFKINFTTYLRLDLMYAHREQIPLLQDMGLRSGFFGIESFNPESAKLIGKGLASDKVKDFLLELKNDYFKQDINFVCSFIIGLPLDNLKNIEDTFEWCQHNDINTIWSPLFIRPSMRYQSDIDKNYSDYGYVLDPDNEHRWTNNYTNSQEAFEMAKKFNEIRNNTLHSWPLFDAASLKLGSWKELLSTRMNDLIQDPNVWQKMQARVDEYKKRLISL